jgi:hypothetical protein
MGAGLGRNELPAWHDEVWNISSTTGRRKTLSSRASPHAGEQIQRRRELRTAAESTAATYDPLPPRFSKETWQESGHEGGLAALSAPGVVALRS